MKLIQTLLGACLIALPTAALAFAQMPLVPDAGKGTHFYSQTNLVSSIKSLKGRIRDKNLLNPWGLVQGPTTPFWIADNNAAVSTVYRGNGSIFKDVVDKKKVPLVVTIPPPDGSATAATPSGVVFNGTATDFDGDQFIFATEDGTISGWQEADGTGVLLHVDNSAIPTADTSAVYKGLAIATLNGHRFLYATNFRSGNVDVFDSSYNPVSLTGAFTDPDAMTGFAPFGITLLGDELWVSYAMQDAAKHDPVHQAGAGYIDIFTTDGVLVRRFATGGNLNAPWGMVLTPADFGPLGGDYWIGNFGDGAINAFDASGNAVGQPTDKKGKPLNVDGLWALVFGNGSNGAKTTSLYFTAGPDKESEGIFGEFQVTRKQSTGMGGNPY